MKKQYYINNVLVRTSERDYTSAVILLDENTKNGFHLIACCGDDNKASKTLQSEKSYYTNHNILYAPKYGNNPKEKINKLLVVHLKNKDGLYYEDILTNEKVSA